MKTGVIRIINIREIGDVIIYELKGRICRTASDERTLHQFVRLDLDKGRRNFLFNFQNVEFIDSFSVSEILASYISNNEMGGNLRPACLPYKFFNHYPCPPPIIEIFDNDEAALKSFRKPE